MRQDSKVTSYNCFIRPVGQVRPVRQLKLTDPPQGKPGGNQITEQLTGRYQQEEQPKVDPHYSTNQTERVADNRQPRKKERKYSVSLIVPACFFQLRGRNPENAPYQPLSAINTYQPSCYRSQAVAESCCCHGCRNRISLDQHQRQEPFGAYRQECRCQETENKERRVSRLMQPFAGSDSISQKISCQNVLKD